MISTRNAVLSVASFAVAASALTVNTPASVVQCQPVQLGWGEGTAPYYVAIIPGGQPAAAALENLPTQQGTSVTWMVDLASGQQITVKVTDATGAINYSDSIPIQAGTETTCTASTGTGSGSSSSSTEDAETTSTTLALTRATRASSSATTSTSAISISRSTKASSSSTKAASTTSAASGINANAAATSAPATGAASSVTAGVGMLVGGLILALVA